MHAGPLSSDNRCLLIFTFIVAFTAMACLSVAMGWSHFNDINHYRFCLELVRDSGPAIFQHSGDCATWATVPQ